MARTLDRRIASLQDQGPKALMSYRAGLKGDRRGVSQRTGPQWGRPDSGRRQSERGDEEARAPVRDPPFHPRHALADQPPSMAPLDRPELGFVDRHEPARPHEHVEGDAAAGQTAGAGGKRF